MTCFTYKPYFAYYAYKTYCTNLSYLPYFAYLFCSFRGKHDCLVPLTPYLAGIFQYLRKNKKLPPRVRAVDMRHVLLVLPFLLDGLLDPAVLEEHNRKHPLRPVHDPSTELVGITILFIQWYMLYRRRYPPKDKEDVKELAALGDR